MCYFPSERESREQSIESVASPLTTSSKSRRYTQGESSILSCVSSYEKINKVQLGWPQVH